MVMQCKKCECMDKTGNCHIFDDSDFYDNLNGIVAVNCKDYEEKE